MRERSKEKLSMVLKLKLLEPPVPPCAHHGHPSTRRLHVLDLAQSPVHVLINYDWAGGWLAFIWSSPPSLLSPGDDISNSYKMTSSVGNIQLLWGKTTYMSMSSLIRDKQHIKTISMNVYYLYSLAVVDFHYMEVKTVYPFARCDEITSLLIKIPPDIY